MPISEIQSTEYCQLRLLKRSDGPCSAVLRFKIPLTDSSSHSNLHGTFRLDAARCLQPRRSPLSSSLYTAFPEPGHSGGLAHDQQEVTTMHSW